MQWRNDDGEWQYYPGDNQPIPLLPVPRVPDDNDKHYLNIYVSNYEINALYWAYFKSGGLDKLVTPESLPDPDLLNTSTYVELVPAFEQYDGDAMYAEISPIEAPINSFQKVYEFTSGALDKLEGAVPEDVFKKVKSKLQGKVFDSKTALQDKLEHYHIEEQYFEAIEKASERLGLVTRQNVELKLVIQDEDNSYPYLTFDVSIVDLLTDLKLAINTVYEVTEKNIEELKIAGIPDNCLDALENLKNSIYRCEKNFVKALENNLNKSEFEPYLPEILIACERTLQTMSFDYKKISNEAAFVATSIEDFDPDVSREFGNMIWNLTGSTAYTQSMSALGSIGVPIPIMKDFHFLFTDADLVIVDGFVSISANVKYQG